MKGESKLNFKKIPVTGNEPYDAYSFCACGNNDFECDFTKFPVAMTYVPMQPWEGLYDLEKGLCRGTIFPSLDLPFFGGDTK